MEPISAARLDAPPGRRMSFNEAARELEATFLAKMLETARKAGEPLAEPSETAGAESYRELAERYLARELARRDTLGFARLLEREVGPRAGNETKTETIPSR